MIEDTYIVEKQQRKMNGNDPFYPWVKVTEIQSYLQLIRFLAIVHNNRDLYNDRIRITRVTQAGSYLMNI